MTEVRIKCPECWHECWWCSWYVHNAREAGCGCKQEKCQKAEKLKGSKCGTCNGDLYVTATIKEHSNG